MQINVSSEIAGLMERAVALAVRQGQFFVGVEHLYAAILDEPSLLPRTFEEAWLNKLLSAQREMSRGAWRATVQTTGGDVVHSPRAVGVTQQAGRLAERINRGPAKSGHLLLAILSDPMSAPSRAMAQLELDRGKLVADLSRTLGAQSNAPEAPHGARAASAP